MKCEKETMLLYAVTDRMWTGKQTLMEQVEDALKGGAEGRCGLSGRWRCVYDQFQTRGGTH